MSVIKSFHALFKKYNKLNLSDIILKVRYDLFQISWKRKSGQGGYIKTFHKNDYKEAEKYIKYLIKKYK